MPKFEKKHKFTVIVAIPHTTRPSSVLRALYDHDVVFKYQPLAKSYEVIPELSVLPNVRDNESPTNGPKHTLDNLVTYKISETVPIIPGTGASWAGKTISFETSCQNLDDGVRCIAHAPAGVHVTAIWRVVKRGTPIEIMETQPAHALNDRESLQKLEEAEEEMEANVLDGWDLVETVELECNKFLMPFVAKNAEQAHRDISAKIILGVKSKPSCRASHHGAVQPMTMHSHDGPEQMMPTDSCHGHGLEQMMAADYHRGSEQMTATESDHGPQQTMLTGSHHESQRPTPSSSHPEADSMMMMMMMMDSYHGSEQRVAMDDHEEPEQLRLISSLRGPVQTMPTDVYYGPEQMTPVESHRRPEQTTPVKTHRKPEQMIPMQSGHGPKQMLLRDSHRLLESMKPMRALTL